MIRYRYNISGTDGAGNSWSVEGVTGVSTPGQFSEALDQAQMAAFEQLTQGKAIYGRPGVSCCGPYRMTRLEIEEIK